MNIEQVEKSKFLFLDEVGKLVGDEDERFSAAANSFLSLYSENRIDLVPNPRGYAITYRRMTTGKGTDVFLPFPFDTFCSDRQSIKKQILTAMIDILIIEEPLVGEERFRLETFKQSLEDL